MRWFHFTLIFLAGLASTAGAATPEQIAGLIERLGSGDYRERQAAFRQLDALGEPALERLKSTLANSDSETRSRVAELIRRIEQRQTTARILAPSLVELNINNLSVKDAVTLTATTTNLPVTLVGNAAKANERRVTYHSGRVPAWEAVDGFLRAAQLTEWDGVTNVAGLPAPQAGQVDGNHQVFMAGNGRMVIRGSRNVRGPQPMNQILVYDGVPPALPTCQAGAVRIRALPVGTPIPNAESQPDELLIPLQVSTETKIDWLMNRPTVKMADAQDEQGQRVTASVIGIGPAATDNPDMVFFNNVLINQMGMMQGPWLGRSQFVGLRLRRGQSVAKTLTEINGVLSLPVRITGELTAISQPLSAAGTLVRTDHAELVLRSVERLEDGPIKMEVSLLLAPEAQPPTTHVQALANGRGNAMFLPQLAGQNIALAEGAEEFYGITLADAKQARFGVSLVGQPNVTYNAEGVRVRATLVFRPGKDSTEPTRLFVRGSYPATVEVPFALKNVTLQ